MAKDIKAGKWNINPEAVAAQSEADFVAYAKENLGLDEKEAKKVYAEAKKATAEEAK